VNAVFPGWHRTELSGGAMPGTSELDDHVLGRESDLQAVARTAFHLATQKDVSGQVWNLDSRLM
jgi:3-oxoacyl-[acyl-carrier protein] reductase